jgi:hypothetical protein
MTIIPVSLRVQRGNLKKRISCMSLGQSVAI